MARALDLAEQMRGQSSGSEHQRAAFFGSFASVYEQMVSWRTELSQPAEVLETMERSRCRSLVDQMAIQGVDLLAGLPADQADKLREAERAAQQRVAELKRQLQHLAAQQDVSLEDRQVRQGKLETQLAEAQQHYVAAYADVRNASPAYRWAVGQDLRPVPLDRLQHWAAERETLVLQYLLGFDGGYVLVVPGGGPARVERITVSQEVSSGLGVEAGPLTAARLAGALNNADGTGVLQRLRAATTPEKTREVTPALAALWQVLIPQPERSAIIDGKFKRLTIIPDSSLAQLPFETLVIGSPEQPRYLLDSGLPTGYAPSATVLLNLAGQSAAKAAQSTEPVLTVGNPQYPQRTAGDAGGLLGQLAMRSSSVLRDGSLPPLPHTEWETDWVQKAFGEHGIRAVQLKGDEATKAAVLSQSPGHRILHLACHGLVDQAYGNLFVRWRLRRREPRWCRGRRTADDPRHLRPEPARLRADDPQRL